jgi:hypothetical protein
LRPDVEVVEFTGVDFEPRDTLDGVHVGSLLRPKFAVGWNDLVSFSNRADEWQVVPRYSFLS